MKDGYYQIPLDLGRVVLGQNLPKVKQAESIQQHMHLIMTTALGELAFDDDYGCSIWEDDFDNLTTKTRMREKLRSSILTSIQKHETRIEKVQVDINVKETEVQLNTKGRFLKKKLDVFITANIRSTNQKIEFNDSFYTGPLSY